MSMHGVDTVNIINDSECIIDNGQLESIISSSPYSVDEEITSELVNSNDGFDALKLQWDILLELSGSHVFQTFEWQRTWWKHFGGKNRLHIIVFRKNDELIAIVPLYLERISLLYKFSFWKLNFIGSSVPAGNSSGVFVNYSPTDYLDLIVRPEYEDQVAELFLLYLKESGDQLNQVIFDEVSEESFLMRKVVPAMEKRDWSLKKIRKENCPRINLPETMEGYLLDLSEKSRHELRYSKRAVTEKKLFRVESADSLESVRSIFDEFVRLHQKRWNSQGLPGIFADKKFTEFLRDVTEVIFERGWLRLKIAKTDDQSLAVDYAFTFNKRLYDYQKAFDFESPLSSKYGPGKTLFYYLMEEAIHEGSKVFDLLRGDERYKMRIANDSRYNWKIVIPDPDQNKGSKYRWFNIYSRLCGIYMRIARERLILLMHLKEWGIVKCLPVYLKFLKNRIRGKLIKSHNPEQPSLDRRLVGVRRV